LVTGLPAKFEAFVAEVINNLRLKTTIKGDDGAADLKSTIESLLNEEKRMALDDVSAFSSARDSEVKCKFCNRGNHAIEKMLGQASRSSAN
jgi:hypothetical protein